MGRPAGDVAITRLDAAVIPSYRGPAYARRQCFLVAVIGKATVWPKANIWPYEIPLILAGLAGLVGWAIYRDRGDGDDADAEQAEPRVPVRPGPLSA